MRKEPDSLIAHIHRAANYHQLKDAKAPPKQIYLDTLFKLMASSVLARIRPEFKRPLTSELLGVSTKLKNLSTIATEQEVSEVINSINDARCKPIIIVWTGARNAIASLSISCLQAVHNSLKTHPHLTPQGSTHYHSQELLDGLDKLTRASVTAIAHTGKPPQIMTLYGQSFPITPNSQQRLSANAQTFHEFTQEHRRSLTENGLIEEFPLVYRAITSRLGVGITLASPESRPSNTIGLCTHIGYGVTMTDDLLAVLQEKIIRQDD